jgi:ABC-type nitrate/sulfonate/bicarbonate transport system substrate-binding protein
MQCGVAVFFAVLIAVLGVTPAAKAAQNVTIALSAPVLYYGAFFIAAQKGYFAEQGLDVQFIFDGGAISTAALLSGSIDGSGSPASALTAILRGGPLRIVMVFNDSPPYKIWATSDIHSLADLKGKTIGIGTRGDSNEIAVRLALKAAGVPADSVSYIPLGAPSNREAAFASGTLPAVVLDTGDVVAMQDRGLLKSQHMIADLSGMVRMPMTGLAVPEKLLSGDPTLLTKMVRAIVEGARYLRAFKNESVAIVGKYQKADMLHADGAEYDEFMRSITRDDSVGDALIASDLDVRTGLLGIDKTTIPPIGKIYDFHIARAVNAELDAAHWKPKR